MNYLALRGHAHFNICLKSEKMIGNPRFVIIIILFLFVVNNYYYYSHKKGP